MVENRAGAGGFTGSNAVAQSAPDGYTFLEAPNSIASFSLIMKVKLDPLVDLMPVALLARSPIAMVINASLPVKTVRSSSTTRERARTRRSTAMPGSARRSISTPRCSSALTGLKMKNVNYKSSAEAQTDLVAGRLQLMFVTVASTLGQIQSGQLRLLAYTDKNYPPGAPAAPTMAEAGVPGMEKAQSWWGIFAPPRLPAGDPRQDECRDQRRRSASRSSSSCWRDPAPLPRRSARREFAEVVKQEIAEVEDFIKTVGIAVAPGGVSARGESGSPHSGRGRNDKLLGEVGARP